jgi:hypothetical protein
MTAFFVCPVQAEAADSLFRSVGGDSVHDAVGTVIKPAAVRDYCVCRLDIFSLVEEEGSDYRPVVIDTDIAVPALDVLLDQFLRRPAGTPPLVRVSVLGHKPSCKAVQFHYAGKILLC